MSRGFLAGAAWGCVVAGLGLTVASQVADLSPRMEAVPALAGSDSAPQGADGQAAGQSGSSAPVATEETAPAAAGTDQARAAEADKPAEAVAAAPPVEPVPVPPPSVQSPPAQPQIAQPSPVTPSPEPSATEAAQAPAADTAPPSAPTRQAALDAAPLVPAAPPQTARPETAVPQAPAAPDSAAALAPAAADPAPAAPSTRPEAQVSAPEMSGSGGNPVPPSAAPASSAALPPDAAQTAVAAVPDAPQAPATTDTAPAAAEAPPLPPLTAEEQALVDAAEALVPQDAAPASPPPPEAPAASPAPASVAGPAASPEQAAASGGPAPDPTSPLPGLPNRPKPGFEKAAEGVTVGRLPRIAAPEADPGPATASTESPGDGSAGGAGTDGATLTQEEADAPAYVRFARPFENPGAKPLFAIVLLDIGGPDIDREALAALPFPVSFAIDPTLPDAATAAAVYRAAGQEVVMLATGLPEGATASDIEVTFQSHDRALPEAVAVLDLDEGGFQGNRALATQVVQVIGGQGRGVLSWDRGLNAASQIARRDGLYNAIVFRSLDADGEASAVIRRYLDRAAFKAAQDGRVMVAGQTRPETIAALLEWAVEGRAATVTLAPVTAVMTAQ